MRNGFWQGAVSGTVPFSGMDAGGADSVPVCGAPGVWVSYPASEHLEENMDLLDSGWSPVWTLGPSSNLTPIQKNANIVDE